MGILQQYWNAFGKYHSWKLPDGHVARVPVVETVEKNIEIDEFDHMKFAFRAQLIQPKVSSRSLAANIIHSIDGWIVREMVKKAHQQGFWMAPIHDCFYSSPNHMNQVRENYIAIMQRIAKNNLVSSILSDIAGYKVNYYKREYDLHIWIGNSEYALS
jgi:DNA-directed RNA polymerase